MPVGIQRLNSRHQPPTDRIVFIKPLPGPSSRIAEGFLSRVAAICHPIMKSHHLSVMTLEEYEPNREFIGRNFNAGEIIQLVLRTRSGAWLGFRSVVMVMMHELAHCMQMNHSQEFWKVRNLYAGEMRDLWAQNYTGEGVWGAGRSVGSGDFENRPVHEGDLPENLCGGTYRSRRRGRKRKRQESAGESRPTYAERQQKRIAKKFGINGQALGEDEVIRVHLEKGKMLSGKPRVANSKRGRELRAQAALARFERMVPAKEGSEQSRSPFEREEREVKYEGSNHGSESETESDCDKSTENTPSARDIDGGKLQDGHGQDLIRVCEEEDLGDIHVKAELQELQDLTSIPPTEKEVVRAIENKDDTNLTTRKHNDQGSANGSRVSSKTAFSPNSYKEVQKSGSRAASPKQSRTSSTCSICSLLNSNEALTCVACSNVLLPEKAPGHWRCRNSTCQGIGYLNSGDSARCGVCGNKKIK